MRMEHHHGLSCHLMSIFRGQSLGGSISRGVVYNFESTVGEPSHCPRASSFRNKFISSIMACCKLASLDIHGYFPAFRGCNLNVPLPHQEITKHHSRYHSKHRALKDPLITPHQPTTRCCSSLNYTPEYFCKAASKHKLHRMHNGCSKTSLERRYRTRCTSAEDGQGRHQQQLARFVQARGQSSLVL